MALDISDAFITQFESEVHVAYQRMGSKLRPLARNITGVTGSVPESRDRHGCNESKKR